MICKNCESIFEGNYCSQCGQKNIEGRFTIKEIVHNFFHNFTHIDSGILFTLKELYIRPGTVVKEYIEGKRKKYFNPFQYLILIVAVSMFLTIKFSLLGPKPDPSMLSSANDDQRFVYLIRYYFYNYFNLILFLIVPVSAFFSRMFFRKSGYNYSENLIFNSYIAAQRTFTFVLLSPFIYFLKNIWFVFIGIYYIFWLVYFIYAFRQFFGEKLPVTIIKFVIMYVLLIAIVQASAQVIIYLFFY